MSLDLSDSDSSGEEVISPNRSMAPYAAQLQNDGDANYSEFAQRQMVS